MYISNVTLANINNTTAAATGYTNFTNNTALQVNLTKGNTYPITVKVANSSSLVSAIVAYIDFNKDGFFDDTEAVMDLPCNTFANNTATASFTIPNDAIEGSPLRMRVAGFYVGANNAGFYLPSSYLCGINFQYGEVEDYNIVITGNLATSETAVKNDGIQIYPNPVVDVLNVTKVSDRATYKIYSAAGQLVDKGNINNGKVNVSSLVKGGYIITIDDKGIEQFKSKFIKK